MTQVLGQDLGVNLGSHIQKISFHINWIWVLIILIFFIGAIITIYIIYMKRLYNRNIIVFENISGQGFRVVLRDKARVIKLGQGGEETLFLRKKKKYITAYGRKMDMNTYWFAVGQDGYWYNIILGDLDAKMGMLDIEPIDRDMRYMQVGLIKNIEDRYRRKQMEKAVMISAIAIIVCLLISFIGMGMMLKKMTETSRTINIGIESSNQVIIKAGEILDKIYGTGNNGMIPAPTIS